MTRTQAGQAEQLRNSRNTFHQTWSAPFSESLQPGIHCSSPERPLDPCPPAGVVDECEELSVVVDVEVAVVRHREPEPHSQTGLSHPGDWVTDSLANQPEILLVPGPQDKRLTGNGEKLTYSCPAGCN